MRARVKLRVYMAWWWRYYARGVAAMTALTGLQPDPDKVRAWARRAVRVKVIPDTAGNE